MLEIDGNMAVETKGHVHIGDDLAEEFFLVFRELVDRVRKQKGGGIVVLTTSKWRASNWLKSI